MIHQVLVSGMLNVSLGYLVSGAPLPLGQSWGHLPHSPWTGWLLLGPPCVPRRVWHSRVCREHLWVCTLLSDVWVCLVGGRVPKHWRVEWWPVEQWWWCSSSHWSSLLGNTHDVWCSLRWFRLLHTIGVTSNVLLGMELRLLSSGSICCFFHIYYLGVVNSLLEP